MIAHNDLWPWPISPRSFSHDFATKLLKYITSCVHPTAHTLIQFWMESFYIWHIWSLAWKSMSHATTFGLDLYLQGHSAMTLQENYQNITDLIVSTACTVLGGFFSYLAQMTTSIKINKKITSFKNTPKTWVSNVIMLPKIGQWGLPCYY